MVAHPLIAGDRRHSHSSLRRSRCRCAKTIGLTVIVPMGIGDDQNRATLVLPRLDVIAATDCLSTSGVPYDLASTIAQAIDRSLPSFRRTNSVNPTHKRPQWANERSDLVAPLS